MATPNNRRSLVGALVAVALLAFVVFEPHTSNVYAQDSMSGTADETQQTEAAVMAVDRHWSIAELTGDTAWLDQMLLPEYRSVGNTGVAHSKAEIVTGAAKRKGTDLATAQQKMAAYEKEHPYGSAVLIHGNTAVISFYDPALGPQKGVKSSDIFVYVDGHWHAMYSQHTAVQKS
ncbi:nuclear transport factor 2 family protein [Dyella sp. 2HG41-7]|uniref:nuclear transport factor 2 family protein n=1 Tax=Dyella sp. 2HG41-7 TaxID=2883239 RepID=UPI001F249D29|nr:nuclear transport factor 2 family protein [Dyella sp. 2HG41-7]